MSPGSRLAMAKTDLSSSSKPHVHTRVSLRKPLRCGFTIVLCSCLLFGAAQCRAQATQDVAEAARQERERKEAKNTKHVYTDEDLRRAKILTPLSTPMRHSHNCRSAILRAFTAMPSKPRKRPIHSTFHSRSRSSPFPLSLCQSWSLLVQAIHRRTQVSLRFIAHQ